MMTELAMASWETIWHRTALMANGTCTLAEYQSMIIEKMGALSQSSAALFAGKEPTDVLRPFHKKATANAKRLRSQ